jgi:hypothetical protein
MHKIQNLIQIIHGDKTVLHVILVGHGGWRFDTNLHGTNQC